MYISTVYKNSGVEICTICSVAIENSLQSLQPCSAWNLFEKSSDKCIHLTVFITCLLTIPTLIVLCISFCPNFSRENQTVFPEKSITLPTYPTSKANHSIRHTNTYHGTNPLK